MHAELTGLSMFIQISAQGGERITVAAFKRQRELFPRKHIACQACERIDYLPVVGNGLDVAQADMGIALVLTPYVLVFLLAGELSRFVLSGEFLWGDKERYGVAQQEMDAILVRSVEVAVRKFINQQTKALLLWMGNGVEDHNAYQLTLPWR